jgi:ParB-like chromosome segregation protein Spo0J
VKLSIADLKAIAPKDIELRPMEQALIVDYAKLMREGVIFPPVIVGESKTGERFLVDGKHRTFAAEAAGFKELPVEVVQYASVDDLLADMLKRNMNRGAFVKPEYRDARIKFLHTSFKWSQERIGKAFDLHQSSVSRILKGTQKARKTQPKGNASAKPKARWTAARIVRGLDSINDALALKSVRGDLAALCWAEGKQAAKAKKRLAVVRSVVKDLSGFLTELDKQMKAEG